MSCRKFSAPRHGSLQFRPKVRSKSICPSIRAFPKDEVAAPCHLTAFITYKAGMTHVIRDEEAIVKDKAINRERMEAVTILEAPEMKIHGVVGYKQTIKGLERTGVLLAECLGDEVVRRMYFKKIVPGVKHVDPRQVTGFSAQEVEKLKKESDIIRVIANSIPTKIPALKLKKAHIQEIQVNGGSIEAKVDYAIGLLEKTLSINDVFSKGELIDTIGVTKGKGFQGVIKRWGVRQLPRKTNKGTRKVACIGAWHPSRVMYSVARAGQLGFHRRTQVNCPVYAVGNGKQPVNTDFDLTVKTINPMGGFVNYGMVNNDYLMIKGSITGPVKRVVTVRKSLFKPKPLKNYSIKFIDTSSKMGSGRFQTSNEKKEFYGVTKAQMVKE